MIIAAYNPKGGVGKTTTAVNVAAVLAQTGRSVLLIDLEAEMNASIALGIRPAQSRPSIAEVLLNERKAADAVRTVHGVDNLHLLTGSPSLADMDRSLRHVRQPERRLADTVRPLTSTFDAIVLDCPSGFTMMFASRPRRTILSSRSGRITCRSSRLRISCAGTSAPRAKAWPMSPASC